MIGSVGCGVVEAGSAASGSKAVFDGDEALDGVVYTLAVALGLLLRKNTGEAAASSASFCRACCSPSTELCSTGGALDTCPDLSIGAPRSPGSGDPNTGATSVGGFAGKWE
ncbi:UNVERIFIED_ORG: hypothetical protein M2402_003199 [Rahnella aquatilis]